MNEILLCAQPTAGQFTAHHKAVNALVATTDIAIMLLVDAMKFKQLPDIFAKSRRRLMQLHRQTTAQAIALGF